MSARERDFVRAARGFGATDGYLLRRHVLPETSSVILTQEAILVPKFVLAEMTLSFLGLGVPEPVPSWGNLLVSLQQYSVLVSYWWMYVPALAIVPFFLVYLGLASALQQDASAAKIERTTGGGRWGGRGKRRDSSPFADCWAAAWSLPAPAFFRGPPTDFHHKLVPQKNCSLFRGKSGNGAGD